MKIGVSVRERAENLVSLMNMDEKIGMMLINSRKMGLAQEDKSKTSHHGVLDEGIIEKGETIFATSKVYGTTHTIEKRHLRHFILRDNFSPAEIAEWINAMNEVAEGTRLGIPVLVTSNSRNENAEAIFGMNDAAGVFSTWPGTLGQAAAAKGDIKQGGDASLINEFARIARKEWDATGIRKGYMYMADVVTDPRWQRTYGTFGEDPEFIADVIGRLITEFQGETLGKHSIALTIKHFPGGGARENGFDPHYEMFALGLFDDRTYNSPEYATEVVSTKEHWDAAYEAHKKSVTILKNSNHTLPLTKDKLDGRKVYVEVFHKELEKAAFYTEKARSEAKELGLFQLTDNVDEADIAILFLHPQSGSYFNATPGFLELEICEDKVVSSIDGSLYQETTLSGMDRLKQIVDRLQRRGGKVVMSVNVILPWILGNVEPLADALVAGYDTFFNAQFEVMAGNHKPTGVLPLTLPASEEVIAVYQNGDCVSRNDVPGYAKDQYMPDGLSYAYQDRDGNVYKLGHGLSY